MFTQVRATDAEVVVTSEWRHDVRLMRMLNAALRKLEMAPVSFVTPALTANVCDCLRDVVCACRLHGRSMHMYRAQ